MKQLTQDIFDGAPDWVKSAAVDSDGECYWYSLSKCELRLQAEWWLYRHIDGATCDYVGEGFDTTDWKNSAIDREATK